MPVYRADHVRRAAQLALLGSFVISLAFTSYRTYLHLFDDLRSHQQADIQKLRELDLRRTSGWKALPKYFEPAFETRVEGRDLAIRRYARFKLTRLHVSSNPRVVLGNDDWLFYDHEAEPNYFTPPDPNFAEFFNEWAVNMPAWRQWLAERNIRLVIVIAPNKQRVYPQYLPTLQQKTWHDRVTTDLVDRWRANDPQLHVEDLFVPLDEAARASERLIYFKTDTHWNTDGMLVGYRRTAAALGLTPLGPDAFHHGGGPTKVGDLTVKLGYWDRPPEPFTHWELKSPRAKLVEFDFYKTVAGRLDYLDAKAWDNPTQSDRAVLFHDSFGAGLYSELLAEHFGRLVAVPSNHLDPTVIEREKPNVVILEIVERQFQALGARGPQDPPRSSVVQ